MLTVIMNESGQTDKVFVMFVQVRKPKMAMAAQSVFSGASDQGQDCFVGEAWDVFEDLVIPELWQKSDGIQFPLGVFESENTPQNRAECGKTPFHGSLMWEIDFLNHQMLPNGSRSIQVITSPITLY